ncbi:2-hydroxychromene-2-carboxylate isomerase [Pararhodobacter sp.]|uniref:2-hydroxychromene-2-carboxylate isomerase n=1 Tax=Pararhodobacter sp. TaxID=2127056 RepID=UPI002FDE7429
MTLHLETYWSFRSPYSYLATPRLVAFAAAHDVTVTIRPVRPLATRDPAFFTRMGPGWRPYLFIDTARQADYLGLPFRRPVPDPIVQDPATHVIATDQPHIRRLTHLGIAAAERGRGLEYIDAVSRLLWSGAVDNWHEGDHLARAAASAGLDHAELSAAITGDPGHHDRALEANEAALTAAGHWGVPCFVFNDEPFFGQDRFDQLVWRMRQNGLAARATASHSDLAT